MLDLFWQPVKFSMICLLLKDMKPVKNLNSVKFVYPPVKVKVIKIASHAPELKCSNAESAMTQKRYHITLSFVIKLNTTPLNLTILMVVEVVEDIVEMAVEIEVVQMEDPFVGGDTIIIVFKIIILQDKALIKWYLLDNTKILNHIGIHFNNGGCHNPGVPRS